MMARRLKARTMQVRAISERLLDAIVAEREGFELEPFCGR